MSSFSSALEVGAEVVEFDVHLTRDGDVVVIHDPLIDRTTDGRGPVRELTLQQIRAVSAGYPSRFGDRFRGEGCRHCPRRSTSCATAARP